MYKSIIRPILFLFDAERVHNFAFRFMNFLMAFPGGAALARSLWTTTDQRLEKEVFGLKFANPVGLAAGFDKNAKLHKHWVNFGFGFVELGTVTPRSQKGNPQPRMFRLPADKALINRMGFNNGGLQTMITQLKKASDRKLIIGGNIGKNKDTPNEQAFEDYRKCFEALHPYVDYFVVNVSSPNTPNLRELQEKGPLTALLKGLQELNAALEKPRPLLLKIAPDLSQGQLDDILDICQTLKLDGIVATNTTISREGLNTPAAEVEAIGNGGLSGAPLTTASTEMIAYIHQKTAGKLPVIAVGGIMSPADAKAKLDAGASLVQVYTGFVYEGPAFAKRINRSLLANS